MARTKGISETVDQVKRTSRKSVARQVEDNNPRLPTGAVMLNLACSDNIEAGYGMGKMVNLIGDSSSGKTLLALSMFAEMARHSKFDDYKFIFDDVEQALEFDLDKLFGTKAECIETIDASNTIQDFQLNIQKYVDTGEPFVYILDSFDALTSKEEIEKNKKNMSALKKDQPTKGSYKVEKPKIGGEILRMIIKGLKQSKSLLIIISQTRDDINPMTFTKKTRSGGNALRFYASHEIWLAIMKKVRKRDRVIGVDVKAKVTKNKITGKRREVIFSIYDDYGIDDIGAMVDFMVNEKFWSIRNQTIIAKELDLECTRQKLIQHIEIKNLERKLKRVVQRTWNSIEESLKLNRKKKFK